HASLQLATENPSLKSEQLAELLTQRTGTTMNAASFRKQLSRARAMLAEELVKQVAQTMEAANREELLDELQVLGLATLVEPFLDLK
ncbi:MAG: hypothetical protein AAF497_10250, partial [Planctomycetota bacterium]